MANVQSKGTTLFPAELVTEMFSKVKGHSSLANLSHSEPIPFNGRQEFTFTMDREVDLVAENGKKTTGGITIAPVTIVPVKVEYGARVSDEFMIASEDAKLEILKHFLDGYTKKVARGLDIMAMHGVNPRTNTTSDLIGNNCFDKKITQKVTPVDETADALVEAAIAMIDGSDGDVTGMALSKSFRSDLSKLKNQNGDKLFPELAWGSSPSKINGLSVDINSTINFKKIKDDAIIGDFENAFKWGFSKEVPMEVIEYGNPDNDAELGDLKGHNQVYIRCETYIGWGILDESSFAIISAK